MSFCVLVLHGPNLSLLARREIDPRLEERAEKLGLELTIVQANGEEGLLDALYQHREAIDAVVVNPGVLAPSAVALAEGLGLLKLPTFEVLLEKPKRPSCLRAVVTRSIHGEGVEGYLSALEALPGVSKKTSGTTPKSLGRSSAGRGALASQPPERTKTLGRAPVAQTPKGKSIGRSPVADSVPGRTVTRALVRARISERLKGKLSAEELASWARETWVGLQNGAATELEGHEVIENALLTLMAGTKASDAVLVAQMAKLDR
jgi:3-dehydroquinate dehydratase II